jgi:hypothetical protein
MFFMQASKGFDIPVSTGWRELRERGAPEPKGQGKDTGQHWSAQHC